MKGFTIIEAVIVLAILGILAAIFIPVYQDLEGRRDERSWRDSDREVVRPGPHTPPYPGTVERYDTEEGPIWIITYAGRFNASCIATKGGGLWCK